MCGGRCICLIWNIIFRHLPKGLRKSTQYFSQDSRRPRQLENDTSHIKIKVVVFINNCIILATYDLAFPTNLPTIHPLSWEIFLCTHFDTRSLLWHLRAILYLPTTSPTMQTAPMQRKKGPRKRMRRWKEMGGKNERNKPTSLVTTVHVVNCYSLNCLSFPCLLYTQYIVPPSTHLPWSSRGTHPLRIHFIQRSIKMLSFAA